MTDTLRFVLELIALLFTVGSAVAGMGRWLLGRLDKVQEKLWETIDGIRDEYVRRDDFLRQDFQFVLQLFSLRNVKTHRHILVGLSGGV